MNNVNILFYYFLILDEMGGCVFGYGFLMLYWVFFYLIFYIRDLRVFYLY